MSKLVRLVGAVLLVGIAGFCVFGFLAAAEAPAEAVGSVRLLYAVVGVASLGVAGWLAWPRQWGV
jgi:hypothetical protein